MALNVKFNLCQTPTCTRLEFTDQTKAYNLIDNPGGYDQNNEVPNQPSTGEFFGEPVTLAITTPANTVYTFNLATAGFPTVDDTFTYTIESSDLGYGTSGILDGIYQAVYTLSTALETFTVSKYYLFTCQTDCCIDKLYNKIMVNNSCCNCENPELQAAIEAEGYVCAAKNALACGRISQAKNLLAKAQSVCSNLKCKC